MAFPDSILRLIKKIRQDLNPEAVVLFGSRARGTSRDDSDYDFAIKARNLNPSLWSHFQVEVDEAFFTLLKVDLVHYETADLQLRGEIDRDGVVIADE